MRSDNEYKALPVKEFTEAADVYDSCHAGIPSDNTLRPRCHVPVVARCQQERDNTPRPRCHTLQSASHSLFS